QRDARARVGTVTTNRGIDLQTGYSRKVLGAAAHLGCQTLRQNRVRIQIGGGSFLRSLSAGEEINDIDRWQGRLRRVLRSKPIQGGNKIRSQVVVQQSSRHKEVHGK